MELYKSNLLCRHGTLRSVLETETLRYLAGFSCGLILGRSLGSLVLRDVVLVIIDERVGGGVVACDFIRRAELGKNDFGELFTKFDAPLIEGVDVPDDALDENFVFVESDQGTQRAWGEFLEHDRVGWTISFEGLVWGELVDLRLLESSLGQFGRGFFKRFALHERFGLGKEIGEQNRVMLTDGVLADDRCEEVGRDELSALVDELVKGVLAVSAGFAPDHRTGGVVDVMTAAVDALAIALHVALLEIGGEAVEILVVGQDGLRGGAVEIIVPDAEQTKSDGKVAFEIGCAEMFVHFVCARQERFEIVKADVEGDGQTDCRPE